MKFFEEKIQPAKTYKECVRRTCDLCGKEAKNPDRSWDSSSCYDVDETEIEVTVRQKEGSLYPEGGSGQEYVIDLCPTCFKTKLVSWLISQGASIKQEYWDC